MYFQKCAIQFPEDPNEKDENLIKGEYWEFQDPEKVEAWGLMMIPNSNNFAFTYKFKNAQCFLNLSFLEKVKDVEPDALPTLRVKCVTTIPECEDQYHFPICIDSVRIPFAITSLLESLEPMPFRGEIKELERRIDNNEWKDVNGSSISWKKLANKIRGLFRDFNVLKGKLEKHNEMSRSRMVTNESQGEGTSQASKLNTPQQSGRSHCPRNAKKSTEKALEQKKNLLSKAQSKRMPVVKTSEVLEVAEPSYAEKMESIPHSRATNKRPDYEEVSRVYKSFWTTCKDAYLFKLDDKKEIDILQLVSPPATFNIRSKENQIVKELVNWLLNMPDKSTRQTLCVMPVDFNEKLTEWKDIEKGKFFVINGQHSVEASKWMMDDANKVDKEEREHFRKWKCFVVWSNDPEKLQTISAFYNRTNHFHVTQPSWVTNILGALTMWEAMGRPRNPTQASSVETSTATRRTMEVRRNKEAF